jgi:hypothetical protein
VPPSVSGHGLSHYKIWFITYQKTFIETKLAKKIHFLIDKQIGGMYFLSLINSTGLIAYKYARETSIIDVPDILKESCASVP